MDTACRPVSYRSGPRCRIAGGDDHQGTDLRIDYAKDVLSSLVRIWKRPVNVMTKQEDKPVMLRFDGKEHSTKQLR